MTKYYVSFHGGEGWEDICEEEDLPKVLEDIYNHWPKVPRKTLQTETYIFPLEHRVLEFEEVVK